MRLSRAHFAPRGPEKRAQSAHFSLSFRPAEPSTGGCAAVISKKVAKYAVSRHLLKRRIYAVLRPFCTDAQAIVVYARPGAPTLPFSDIQEELTQLLAQVGLSE